MSIQARRMMRASQTTSTAPGVFNLTTSHLSSLAGTSEETGGTRVHETRFLIVQQDGTGGQRNAPVNLSGAHLKATGDFKVSVRISEVQGAASFRLYGGVPVIADEFRTEPPSIEVTRTATQIIVKLWDGSINGGIAVSNPIFMQSYAVTPTSVTDLTIQHVGSTLQIIANGMTLDTQNDRSIFSGKVWLGASSESGSYLLSSIQASRLGSGTMELVDTSSLTVTTNPVNRYVQKLASNKRPGFLVGAAMALGPAVSDQQYRDIAFGGNFGIMTTENALKWQFIRPSQTEYDFNEGDALVRFAQRHNMEIHGHTLVFGEANPSWVTQLPRSTANQKQQVKQVMTDHITTVLGHYAGQMKSWDVVNEPIAAYDDFNGDQGRILRDHVWHQAMGETYISHAFNAARQADPAATLYMNEYGLEENGERWDAFYALVVRLKQAGVPIDGVGFQAHVYSPGDRTNTSVLVQHMQQLAAIDVESRISEMDVYSYGGTTEQATEYTNVLTACINEPSCKSWTTWGVSDRYNMYMEGAVPEYGQDFLWTDTMSPTSAVTAILNSLE